MTSSETGERHFIPNKVKVDKHDGEKKLIKRLKRDIRELKRDTKRVKTVHEKGIEEG